MIINSKWWEDHENVATTVKHLATTAVMQDDPMAWRNALAHIVEVLDDLPAWREEFVAAILADSDVVICRCGECQGKEWSVGEKLQAHFCGLLDRGRSLNFA